MPSRIRLLPLVAALCATACTVTPNTFDFDAAIAPGRDGAVADSSRPSSDSATRRLDLATQRFDLATAAPDLATSSSDGTPIRRQCTSNWGSDLSTQYGRLDGYLVAIVPSGYSGCNGDSHHIHLQVQMNGGIYDVAVDIIDRNGGALYRDQLDMPLTVAGWSEGWHPGDGLSYTGLGLHASDFTVDPNLETTLDDFLASANHVSIYGTGYNANGMHLVHFDNGSDGAIVTDPLSSSPHFMLLRFASQSF